MCLKNPNYRSLFFPEMSQLKTILAALLFACWIPATSLCLLERAGWIACNDDGCPVGESSQRHPLGQVRKPPRQVVAVRLRHCGRPSVDVRPTSVCHSRGLQCRVRMLLRGIHLAAGSSHKPGARDSSQSNLAGATPSLVEEGHRACGVSIIRDRRLCLAMTAV